MFIVTKRQSIKTLEKQLLLFSNNNNDPPPLLNLMYVFMHVWIVTAINCELFLIIHEPFFMLSSTLHSS